MNKAHKITLATGFGLALAFTFSCSNGDDNNGSSSSGTVSPYTDKGNDISKYRTTNVGDQTWIAENLNYKVPGSKCYGEDGLVEVEVEHGIMNTITLSDAEIQANCDIYGRLYDWATAMALPSSCNFVSCEGQVNNPHRGICPEGWHIPNWDEWKDLFHYAGDVSGKLKSTSGWVDPEDVPTDEYGFSALPGGRAGSMGFDAVGYYGQWWIATEYDGERINARYMSHHGDYADQLSMLFLKSILQSVRCLED